MPCNVAQKQVHLASAGSWLLRGLGVALLSWGSRMVPSLGWQSCGRISCNVVEKLVYLAPAGSWPLRGVRVGRLYWGSCIPPTVGQWNCGRILCNMTRIDCYHALPDLLRLQEPGTAGPFRIFRRLTRKVTPVGFEPTTLKLEVSCSIQLSYGAVRQRVPL